MVGVTTLLKLLNKEALLSWSNKIGLQGIALKDYRRQSSTKGTNTHIDIQMYLLHGTPFESSHKIDELLLDCEILGIEGEIDNGLVCGRYDLLIKKDGNIIVVDFKSSSKVYLEQKIQLSSYKEMLGADKIAIINFKDWIFNELHLDTEKYYKILKHLYVIYGLKMALGEL